MNGRTAQESRLPKSGGAAANGTNGHAPQSAPHSEPASEWQPGQQVGEIQLGRPDDVVRRSEWLSEVRDRPRDTSGTTLRQFNTPVRVDEIAVAAMTLAEDLHAATQNMPESVELRRFRQDLDQAATTFRDLASRLEVTAGKLVRLAANEGQACGVGWGVCPEHGLTLMNVGETVTCHVLGCGRENEGEVERCEHPVAYRVVDAAGPALLTCTGHAIACRLYFDNPVITATADSMELF
ncbi:hypothetical protein AB0L64_07700 [Kribbella sp. NPDC051936]|uniref:hypothetical protein n=1 Tax=Kribbella sp. NPDC051936 TaxID=3154946 RepID=UPI00342F98F4